ncbi:MAG: hypothetical protein KDA58_01790 [Planctomycetaceae bacterium]|nr:hypothetical protein [Planctomycetaceae bacterium]
MSCSQTSRRNRISRRSQDLHCVRWGAILLVATTLGANHLAAAGVTGAQLVQKLDQPISVVRGEVPLGETLDRLSEEQQVAILLDRRIDPGALVVADIRRQRFETALGQLATQVHGGLSVVADTVYVGPTTTVRRLRTLVALREKELLDLPNLGQRAFALTRRQRIQWPMLAEPRQLLADIASQYDLHIDGLELVPHDLWRAGELNRANVTESLLLILMQFDLAFTWSADGRSVTIVPAPGHVSIERSHRPRGMSLEQAEHRVNETLPDVATRSEKNELVFAATIEEHEVVAQLLGEKPPESTPAPRGQVELARQRFTLRVQNQPARALLDALQRDGVAIEYDSAQLADAGINLDQLVQLELKQATIRELMDGICRPLGLKYEIAGNQITLIAGEK